MKFLEVGETPHDVVQRVRALRVTGEIGDLPGRQIGEDLTGQGIALAAQPGDLVGDVEFRVIADELEFVDSCLKLGDALLEVQKVEVHRLTLPSRPEF